MTIIRILGCKYGGVRCHKKQIGLGTVVRFQSGRLGEYKDVERFRSVPLLAAGLAPAPPSSMPSALTPWSGQRAGGLKRELPGMPWRDGLAVSGSDDLKTWFGFLERRWQL